MTEDDGCTYKSSQNIIIPVFVARSFDVVSSEDRLLTETPIRDLEFSYFLLHFILLFVFY